MDSGTEMESAGTRVERIETALAAAGEPAVAPPECLREAVDDAVAPPKLDRRYVTAAMMVVMVLASMEQTITTTAMPTIIGDMRGLEHYSWVAAIYLLACTVSMPLYGRLADAIGRKKVVLAAIGIFCAASLLAAGSQTMLQLIIFRGLQGLGAGGIMPLVLTILGDIFTLQERARIQGFFSAVWGTASLAGPALGALIVHQWGWRWIFFVNLPLGVLSFAVLAWKYHDQEKPHTTDLDLPGVAALAVAAAATLALVSRLGPGGWPWEVSVTLLIIAGVSWIAFLRIERSAANPILPPSLMMNRAIGPALWASCLLGVAFLSLDTYVPLYVQGVRGGGAAAAASVVTPVMLTWALSGLFAAPLVIRWGFRRIAILGCLLTVASFAGLLVCVVTEAPQWVMTGILLFSGFGFGPASFAYILGAQNAVGWQQRGIITSAIQFFRTMGGAVGIGVLGGVFNVLTAPQMQKLHETGINAADAMDPLKRDAMSPETLANISHMIGGGLLVVFIAMFLCAIAQLGVSMMMSKPALPPLPSRERSASPRAG